MLFVCLFAFFLFFSFHFFCSVSTVCRHCVVNALRAPLPLVCRWSIWSVFPFNFPFRLRAHVPWPVWSTQHDDLSVCVCLLASQVACYVYCVHTALHAPCFVCHARFWHSHVMLIMIVSYDSGEHTVTDVAATTTASSHHNHNHCPVQWQTASAANGQSHSPDSYKFDGPTFSQNQFIFVIWRNRVISSEPHTKYWCS